MSRIIIASTSEQSRTQLAGLLTSSGFPVYRCCTAAGDLRRTVHDCEDGIVIISGAIPGCSADELHWDYCPGIQILLIGKPALLNACESQEIFRLAMPTTGQAVLGAVSMLSQLHQMRLPRRQAQERSLVEQAKKRLMVRSGLSEAQAHRAMQEYCMHHGIKMSDYASQILSASADMEE